MTAQSSGAVTVKRYVALMSGWSKHGIEAMRLVRLEVGVDVLLAVLGIDEAMEAVAGHVVVVDVLDVDGRLAADDLRRAGSGDSRSIPARRTRR